MKKLFVVICLFLFNCVPAFAEYKPISSELSIQYKKDMEQIINENYPIVITDINNEVKKAKKYYKQMKSKGYSIEDYINLTLISENCIPSTDLKLYEKLMQTTQEKYLGVQYVSIGTDNTIPLDKFLTPYFIDNNVDTKKLSTIIKYQNKKSKIVEKYIKQAELLKNN